MIRRETWDLALDALRANKVRAMLTMFGVIIGSACIVLVVTVALAAKRYVIGQIEGVGSNLVYAELLHGDESQPNTLADEITPGDLEAVKRSIAQVTQVAGTRDIPMTVVVGGIERPVNLVGVTEGFQQIRNLVVLRGRYLDSDDMQSRSKVCVITQDLASLMFAADDPVGRSIRLGELNLTVIGVFRERVATFGQTEITRESLIVPFPLVRYYTGSEYIKMFYAQADRPEDVLSVTRQVGEIVRSRHRPTAEYRVQNLTGILETARHVSWALTVVLLLIALIALAVSGVGIMNIMLVTVTERTHEIGIRMAIGARRKEILEQFLIEAFLISGTGAVVGILIAVLIPISAEGLLRLLPVPGNITIPVSWISVLVAFTVSSATGLLFGYLPANRAAALQPTESLRHE